jgi:hypothetical protein
MQNQTPIYNPNFPEEISPRKMWEKDLRAKPTNIPVKVPGPAALPESTEALFAEEAKQNFKNLSDGEKNILSAAIVCSNAWRKFLKPYLEASADPPRRAILNEADKYKSLNDNAVAVFAKGLLTMLEVRAKSSPSVSMNIEEDITQ